MKLTVIYAERNGGYIMIDYMPEEHISICPECGKIPKLMGIEGKRTQSYKFSCGLHISCGDWFSTPEAAAVDWERRVKEYSAPKSKPGQLSIEKLKKINLDMANRRWVWIELLEPAPNKESGYYRVIFDWTEGSEFCCGYPGMLYSFPYAEYSKTWLAFIAAPNIIGGFNIEEY